MIRPTIEELHDFAYDYLDNLYKIESSNDETIIPTTSNSNNNDNNLQQTQNHIHWHIIQAEY